MLQLDWHLTQGPGALFRSTFGRAARALELIFDTFEIDEVNTFCRGQIQFSSERVSESKCATNSIDD